MQVPASHTATSRPAGRSLALIAALPLVLAACAGTTSSSPQPSAADTSAPTEQEQAAVPPELADFYGQQISWEGCEPRGTECGHVTVPLDYDDPQGATIDLFLKRTGEPSGENLGNLLVNPGGPGGDASTLVDGASFAFTDAVREHYRIVGMDPRGVGRSQPVDCVSDAELDTVLSATYDTDTPAGLSAYLDEARSIAQSCAQNSGVDLLANITTEDVARDMDVVRHVLGETRLNYLGFSYGTFLGGMYAHLFPQNVGRMVLDGGMDPTLSTHEVVLGQATGFEGSLRAWAQNCAAQGGDCPFEGDAEAVVGQVADLLAAVKETPLPSESGRSVTASLATMGVLTALYQEAAWPQLSFALSQAVGGDGTALLALADLGSGRQPDGTYASNSTEALWAVNCADHPAEKDDARWDQDARAIEEAAPIFGPSLAYADAMCAVWPEEAQPTAPVPALTAPDAAPILVVGTTGDPATPYVWSEALVEQLGGTAQLLTVEGWGHTAYIGLPKDCVVQAVDGYLVDGTMPEKDATCA